MYLFSIVCDRAPRTKIKWNSLNTIPVSFQVSHYTTCFCPEIFSTKSSFCFVRLSVSINALNFPPIPLQAIFEPFGQHDTVCNNRHLVNQINILHSAHSVCKLPQKRNNHQDTNCVNIMQKVKLDSNLIQHFDRNISNVSPFREDQMNQKSPSVLPPNQSTVCICNQMKDMVDDEDGVKGPVEISNNTIRYLETRNHKEKDSLIRSDAQRCVLIEWWSIHCG